jgi:hypothetical protein
MPRRDRRDNTTADDLVSQFALAPLTDRSLTVGWFLARQADHLTHLLGRELRRGTTPRGIRQPLGRTEFLDWHLPKLEPAPSPVARRLVIQTQLACDLRVVQPVAGC